MRTPRPLATAIAAVAAVLTVAVFPGTAAAEPVDGLDCTVTRQLINFQEVHTCVAESEDIRWKLTGRCAMMFGIQFVSSPVVEGSGTAMVGCPIAGPISGPVHNVVRVVL
ncbi:hypothetical protein ACOQFV_00850 [Nocardiopsis changdeensis]|uniref:Uncharacterized protein n=1 Tax=Nocardiopsis changdeensis TaxID=2831969 RepID=A0ABX8BJ35_9ACTN|nr:MULTISPECIES: hypothetical protein [Nocardiopsis]QUX22230.1 hypothetical protein KGD84_28435 [Nocardiopsis changdeensis]QYX38170.1 hypothetical protein K1J57_05820 [Nocardiopsis sp. MT53]